MLSAGGNQRRPVLGARALIVCGHVMPSDWSIFFNILRREPFIAEH